jgi:hypothetical protein
MMVKTLELTEKEENGPLIIDADRYGNNKIYNNQNQK